MTPKVSIILLTYNRAYCIAETLWSIVRQSYTDWELIICDDHSTDDTEDVVNLLSRVTTNPVWHHINSVNVGVPANRNIGLGMASGSLILFLEDDVVIDHDYLRILVETYDELKSRGYRVGAVGGRCISAPKKGKLLRIENSVADKVRKKHPEPSHTGMLTGLVFQNFTQESQTICLSDVLPPWSLYSKSAISTVGNYDAKSYNMFNYSHEETDMFIRLRRAGYKLFYQSKAISQHKHANKGGTRTSQIRYYYYFVGSHMAYLIKNYHWKAAYMILFCLGYLCWNGTVSGLRILVKEKNGY